MQCGPAMCAASASNEFKRPTVQLKIEFDLIPAQQERQIYMCGLGSSLHMSKIDGSRSLAGAPSYITDSIPVMGMYCTMKAFWNPLHFLMWELENLVFK